MLVVSSACLAQYSEQYRTCMDGADTQLKMNRCAGAELTRTEAEGNRLYAELLSAASGQSEAVEKIKAAESAWIAYRDAYLDAMYPAKDKQAEYGSAYPMEAALARVRLTQLHLQALRELLRRYSDENH